MPPQSISKPSSQNRLLTYLFEDEDARACKDIPESACNDQPKNFFIHVASLSLTKTGDAFMDPKITLSWLLGHLGASSFYLGLLVPIHNTFALLPQLLIAAAIRRLSVRKWLWSGGALGQALALVAMAWSAVSLEGDRAGFAIVASLLLFALARGVCSVSQKDVLGKTVAKKRRGRVSGYSEALAGLATLGLALWLIFNGERTVQVVAAILLIAALLWLLAAALFSRMAEQPGATAGGSNAMAEALEQFRLLRDEPEFRRFVLVRTALLGSALMAPYLVALIQDQQTAGLRTLGSLLLAASLASFLSGSIWGSLADRSSARCMFRSGVLAGLTGFLALLLALLGLGSSVVFAGCVFLLYLAHAGVRVGRKTHLIDMANAENRSAMVAVSNTVIGVNLLLFAGIGAAVGQLHDYGSLAFFSAMALWGGVISRSLDEVQ